MGQLFKTSAFRKFHGIYWLLAGSALFVSGLSQGPFIVSLTRNVYFTVVGATLTYLLAGGWQKVPGGNPRTSLFLFLMANYALGTVLTILINPVTYGQMGVPFDQLTWRHIFAGSMNFGLVMLFWAVLFYFLFAKDTRASARSAIVPVSLAKPVLELEVEHNGGTRLVRTGRISHLKAAGDYVEIHMMDGTAYLKRATIQSLRRRLGQAGFVKIHRSIVINRNALTGFESCSKGSYELVMKNGGRLQTSRRCKAEVEALLDDAGLFRSLT